MPSSSRKRKADDVSDASGEQQLTKKERRLKSREKALELVQKRRSSLSGRPDSAEATPTAPASTSPKEPEEDLTPRRKKARIESSTEIPSGMSKKEWVAMRKKQMKDQYESGTLFKAHVPVAADSAGTKSLAGTKSSPKKKAQAVAPVSSSRPAPTRRPTAQVPSASSRPQGIPRRPSGPFNSPIPNMQFSASATRTGPHIPDFSGTNDATSPTQYLSPRSALAKIAANEAENLDSNHAAGSPYASTNVEVVRKEESSFTIVPPSSQSNRSFACAAVCIALVGFCSLFVALVMMPGGSAGDFKFVAPISSASHVRCFKDSPSGEPNEESESSSGMIAERCKNVPLSSWSSCPDGAECAHGLLQKCANSKYYDVNPGQDDCVLSIHTQKMISDIVSWLELSSVVHACHPGGNPHALEKDDAGYPFFGLSQVFGELDMEWDPVLIQILKDLEGVIEVEQQPDGNFHIALHPSHVIVLPRKCGVKKVLRGIMDAFTGAFFGLMHMVIGSLIQFTSIYLELMYEVPTQTLAFSIVLPIVGWLVVSYFQKRRYEANEVKQLNSDRVFVRQEVYKVLRNEPDKNHIVLQVRDQILYDPNLSYHSDSKARNRIIKKVWSKVVADLQKDNRIVKARINTNKGACDSWKWIGDSTL